MWIKLEKKSRIALLLVLCLGASITLYAQERETYIINAQIVESKTLRPIPNAHIINLHSGYGVTSDTAGYFHTPAITSDTLRISAIGYETYKITAIRFLGFLKQQLVQLTPKVYMLDEMDVKALSYNSFRDSVYAKVIPESEWKEQRWIEKFFTPEELQELKTIAQHSGITFNYIDKDDRQRIKVKELEAEQIEANKAEERYNPALVARLTNLSGDSLTNFMRYMGLGTEQITKLNDYQLITEINSKLKAYRAQTDSIPTPQKP